MEEKVENKLKKRLVIDITPEFHCEIKARAALRNIPIRTWVIRAIYEQLKKEKQYE